MPGKRRNTLRPGAGKDADASEQTNQHLIDYAMLGRRVRAARLTMGLTQAELSERLNVSPSFMGHIERGSRVTSVDTFVRLCNELHVYPSFLLADVFHPGQSTIEALGSCLAADSELPELLRLALQTVDTETSNNSPQQRGEQLEKAGKMSGLKRGAKAEKADKPKTSKQAKQ